MDTEIKALDKIVGILNALEDPDARTRVVEYTWDRFKDGGDFLALAKSLENPASSIPVGLRQLPGENLKLVRLADQA